MPGLNERQVTGFVQLMELVQDRLWQRARRHPNSVQGDWHIPRLKILRPAGDGTWNRDLSPEALTSADLAPLAESIVDDYLRDTA